MKLRVAALFALLASASGERGVRPNGPSCDVLPNGFCHRRTTLEEESVRRWNRERAANANNGGNGRVRGGRNGGRRSLQRFLGEFQDPPTYNVSSPGEYEPVEGILLAFDGSSTGSSTYDLDVVAGIAEVVTNGNQVTPTNIFMVANSAQESVARSAFESAGVDMSRVEFITENIDSVWIRDYGPRMICNTETGLKASVDTKYYGSRPNDDKLPRELGASDQWDHDNFDLNAELFHSGGNAHYFSTGKAFASTLLLSDNDSSSEAQLKQYFRDYKDTELHLFPRLSSSVDGTGHIDMWFLPVDDATVIIGQWAEEDSYGSKAVTDNAAAYMAGQGYTVYRVPNWNSQQKRFGYSVHYTYTNAVIANDVVVLSKFVRDKDNVDRSAEDAAALAAFQAAFPGKTIRQVDSSSIIERSGALHCIAQHVYDCDNGSPPGTTTTTTTTTTTGGTTTTTTTTTTTSCSDAVQCPDPASACETKACVGGACVIEPLCPGQTCSTDCAGSALCDEPGCSLSACDAYANENDCEAAGCNWQRGNGPSAGCSGASACVGTPVTPFCV